MLLPQRHSEAGGPRLLLQRSEMKVKAVCLPPLLSPPSLYRCVFHKPQQQISCPGATRELWERQLFVCRQRGSLFIHQHLPQRSPMSLGEPFYGKRCSVQMLLHPSIAIVLRNPETLKLHQFKSQVFLSSVCDLMIKTPKENEHPEISSSSKIRSDCAVWKALGSPGFP